MTETSSPRKMPRGLADALRMAAVAATYVATAKLGLAFDALAGVATTVWPPTGVALAAVVLGGRRMWPAILVGAFVVAATTGISPWAAAAIAVGNTGEALAAATLLARWHFQRQLGKVRDVLVLAAVALVATTISATVGLATIALGGIAVPDGYHTFWLVWWVGDVLGALLLAPAVFCWVADPHLPRRPVRWVEPALLAAALVLVGAAVFHDTFEARVVLMLRGTYSMWPVLLWAALRFRQRGIAAALLLLAVIVVSGTAAGHGVFGSETMHERLFRAQCYMGITAVSLLTLAAALAERRQAIRARDEFISIASHELKTPLTALKLRLSTAQRLATRAQETPERRERLDHTLATAGTITHRLTRLVDELLEVSRLTSRRLVLHLEPVAAGAMLREVVGRLREQVAEGGSAIMLELSPAVEAMIGLWDRVRVEQVLTNLLSNAVKYGQGKDIAVSARTEGNRIRVAVVDAGMGIAEADQVRIFQAFERVESTHAVGGLGLGLYIGRRIAEGHGGTLSVVSAPGKGSTFVLELPQAASPPREAADQPR